ncbi:hypothetical protein M422DRAFT_255870 [Sphaerobolus stellatus SS14]|uniref:Uncharacterized protein n=1 Tax=Sphaerobolus stellatus (strain SS14) TaxID=990650 RepID=A0A0C9VRR1_SPHS4|nr:hypothetical protein M422DRAFT_255870 [Sphaerobolus stellatus SS14]
MLSLLMQNPNLRECYIDYHEDGIPEGSIGSSIPVIHLPSLYDCTIHQRNGFRGECLQEILRKLRTANLELLLYSESGPESISRLPSLLSWLCSTPSKIVRLNLTLVSPIVQELHNLLQELPGLRELLLSSGTFDSEGIRILNRNLYTDICPHLTTLVYTYCRHPLVDMDAMARSRLGPSSTSTGMKVMMVSNFDVFNGVWTDEDGSNLDFIPRQNESEGRPTY